MADRFVFCVFFHIAHMPPGRGLQADGLKCLFYFLCEHVRAVSVLCIDRLECLFHFLCKYVSACVCPWCIGGFLSCFCF